MLKLVKISVFSLVVSFAAFSDNNQAQVNNDGQGLELGQNSDYFLIDTVKSAFSSVKNFVTGKLLGGCDEVKKAGITSKDLIPSKDDCAGDKTCLDNRDLMKSCF